MFFVLFAFSFLALRLRALQSYASADDRAFGAQRPPPALPLGRAGASRRRRGAVGRGGASRRFRGGCSEVFHFLSFSVNPAKFDIQIYQHKILL